MKKLTIAAVTVALLSLPAYAGGNNNLNLNLNKANAEAKAKASSHSRSSARQSVTIDYPAVTLGVGIGSSNNSPCGRTFLGIPMSGHNCTVRMEAEAIYLAMYDAYGSEAASKAAVLHLCRNDKTMRESLVAAGVCKVKK